MKKSLIVLFLVGLLILPVISLGQSIPSTPTGSQSLGAILGVVMGLIWEIAFALAVIMFIAAGIMFLRQEALLKRLAQQDQPLCGL